MFSVSALLLGGTLLKHHILHFCILANCCVELYTESKLHSLNNLGIRISVYCYSVFVHILYTSNMAVHYDICFMSSLRILYFKILLFLSRNGIAYSCKTFCIFVMPVLVIVHTTGPQCVCVDDASGQQVEADARRPATEPSSNLRPLVATREQVCRRQRSQDGVSVLLWEWERLVD